MTLCLKIIFLVCPICMPVFFLFSNEPELGAKIYPGMALIPFPTSILDEIQTHNLSIVSRVR